ncbi:MAG: metallophosphoesterase [Nitrososphaerota archaeon]
MRLKFILGWPALLVEKPTRSLIVADVHFGFEAELAGSGIRVPSQAWRLERSLIELCEEAGAEKLIFLGDLKHMIPLSSWIEWREMPEAIRRMRELGVELILIPGNHDGGVDDILGDLVSYQSSRGMLIEGGRRIFLFHGHAWPDERVLDADVIVMGHLHPVVSLRTDIGSIISRKVWLYASGDKKMLAEKLGVSSRRRGRIDLIVMPAFNPIVSGLSVNSLQPRERLWPLVRSGAFDLDKAEAITLEGERLGYIGYLRRLLLEREA